MLQFVVDEPLKVPLYKRALAGDIIREQFWPSCRSVAQACGCYIFAIPKKRGASGHLPIYVGKATRTFEQECFTSDKLTKINRFLLDRRTDELLLILLRHPRGRGRINARAIEELESNLIRFAVAVNPRLINKQGIKPENWGIRGVLRGGRGRASRSASILKEMLGLDGEVGGRNINTPDQPDDADEVYIADTSEVLASAS